MTTLLRVEELADLWKVSPSLLRSPAWRQRHGLTAIRVGRLLRFSPASVSEFTQRHAEEIGGVANRGADVTRLIERGVDKRRLA